MAGKSFILDPSTLDMNQVVADIDAIRQCNPQRHEMEQLTKVVYVDDENSLCAGYKDIGSDEFWARGHMPGMPLMPGVIMCEAAAQLCSYYVFTRNLMNGRMLGFGGMEDVRFRGPVVPGDRLLIVVKQMKIRPGRMIVSRFEAFVGDTLVVDGSLKGIPLPIDALKA